MNIIEVDRLVKRYGSHTAVDGVSFAVEEGEIFGIVGPNGAGKTTIVESIEGLRVPDGGTIRVSGIDPQRDAGRLRHVLGAQLQSSELPDKLRVGEAMALYSAFYRDPVDWRKLLGALQLTDKITSQFRRLSGGQKQRLAVALAMVGNPKVIVLDELTTGLDPGARRDVWHLVETVRERGVSVLLVTHFMEEAERLSDRLAIIDAGQLIALDTPAGLIAQVAELQRIRFTPSTPLASSELTALPEVESVERVGGQLIVAGTGNLLLAVAGVLARLQITPADFRVEQTTLEDAFLALTDHPADTDGASR